MVCSTLFGCYLIAILYSLNVFNMNLQCRTNGMKRCIQTFDWCWYRNMCNITIKPVGNSLDGTFVTVALCGKTIVVNSVCWAHFCELVQGNHFCH